MYLDVAKVCGRTQHPHFYIGTCGKIRSFARRTTRIRNERVVVKDNAGQGARQDARNRGDQAILEHAAQRMAFSGPLTAADESTRWSGDIVEQTGILATLVR
jgi:hypothetical protein